MTTASSASYPAPRERGLAVSAAAPGASIIETPVPVVRLWPFYLRENGEQAVGVSPWITGPAIIDEVEISWSGAGGTPNPTVRLLIAGDNSGSGNQPLTTVISGTPVYETIARSDNSGGTQRHAEAHTMANQTFTFGPYRWRIGRFIELESFTVKIILTSEVGFDNSCFGQIRIVEQVARELAPNFL